MTDKKKSNIVPLKKATEKRLSSTQRIWGQKVLSHGYAGVPSLLIRNQKRLGLSTTQMCMVIQLLDYWFDKSRPPFPTKKQLADRIGINHKTVQKNMRELEQIGYIQREQQTTSSGDFGSNIYHLDGLVEKIKSLEPEFAKAREDKAAIDKKIETPKGRRRRIKKVAT